MSRIYGKGESDDEDFKMQPGAFCGVYTGISGCFDGIGALVFNDRQVSPTWHRIENSADPIDISDRFIVEEENESQTFRSY